MRVKIPLFTILLLLFTIISVTFFNPKVYGQPPCIGTISDDDFTYSGSWTVIGGRHIFSLVTDSIPPGVNATYTADFSAATITIKSVRGHLYVDATSIGDYKSEMDVNVNMTAGIHTILWLPTKWGNRYVATADDIICPAPTTPTPAQDPGQPGVGCCYAFIEGATCDAYFTQSSCEADVDCRWNPLCDPATALNEFVKLIARFIYWAPFFGVLLSTFVLIIGGFMYITFPPDNWKKMQQARYTISYALIGIVLSASLYLIMRIFVAIIPGLSKYIQL